MRFFYTKISIKTLMGYINTQMKPAIVIITTLFLCGIAKVNAQKNPAAKKAVFTFGISSSDYNFFKNVQDSSLPETMLKKDWLKPELKSFGVSIGYLKPLTKHIDFSGSLTGTFSNFSKNFVKGDSIGQASFTPQLDAMLHFRLLKNNAIVNPFLAGGIGAGSFFKKYAVYAPVGAGLQFTFNGGTIMLLQSQWRKALTDGIANDYLHYSLGFAHHPNWKKQQQKEVPQKNKTSQNIPVKEKQKATEKITAFVVDTDKDGVEDAKDNCPTVKGKLNGCPDADNDSIADKDDECKYVAGIAKYKGCPYADADKDGVSDETDKCPTTAGVASLGGCPEISKELKAKFAEAAQNIFFASGSNVILMPKSKTALEFALNFLKENPLFHLKIEAHADNQGTFGNNIDLSQKRAKAVANYFLKNGIPSKRLIHRGYGDTQPIADNSTAAGRAKNRRVVLLINY